MKDSIYGELPPLRCNYQLAPIAEDTPYVAMEQFGNDGTNNNHSPNPSCCPFGFGFCCGARTK
jgi:hypothetical protein